MLLANTPHSNRKLMALITRVEERELLQDVLAMVNQWIQELNTKGEEFKPIDSNKVKY